MSYKKFTKDMGFLGLAQLVSVLGGIITLPIITKLLGAENYGIWTQILVTMGLISPVALLALPYSLVRFLPGEKNKEEIQDGVWSVFALILCVCLVISLFLIIFSNPISVFLGAPKVFILLLAFITIFECLNQLFSNIFRAFQQIKTCSFLGIAQKLSEAGLIILTILLGYGLFGAILSLLIVRIVMFIIMGGLIIKRIGIKIPKFLRIKEYLHFSLPIMPADFAYWVIQSSDRYFVGFFLGTIFVGYYMPAYTLGGVLSFFMGPLVFLLPATLAKHHDENEIEKVKNYLKYSLKYFLLIAIPSVFGLSILSKQLLIIFSTPDIAQHSYFVIPFIALSSLIFGIYTIIGQVIVLKKKTYINLIIWSVAAFLNFGLNLIFVPRIGILGAAITTLLAYFAILAMTWYYSFKKINFKINWDFILKSLVASTLMSILVLWINPVGLFKTLFAIFVGAILYFFLIFLFKGFEKSELNHFKGLLTKGS